MTQDLKKKGEENKSSSSPIAIARELEECQKKRDEYLAGWQRARADFLNYKKEEMERIKEILKYGNENLISKILPILDNFEKAEKEMSDDKKNDKLLEGVLQIKTQFQDFLKNQGIEEIKTIGEKFDPNLMEVIEEVEPAPAKASAGKSGIVIEETQKGYILNGKVIRPAKVKISK